MPPTAKARRQRSDARANYERIVHAGRELFAAKGTATHADVARAAGIGKATVFRVFPSREAMISAFLEPQTIWIEARVCEAILQARQGDPWTALAEALYDIIHRIREDRIAGMVFDVDTHAVGDDADRLATLSDELIALGIRAGRVRSEVTSRDLRRLIRGLALALSSEQEARPEEWDRCVELTLAACAVQQGKHSHAP